MPVVPRGAWVIVLAIGGCGGEDPPIVDAPDGGGALGVAMSSAQQVPGQVAPDRTIDYVRLHGRTIRAIGDAAPGDARTTLTDADVIWDDGVTPPRLAFSAAPAGVYSTLEVRLDRDPSGDEYAYRIEGEAEVGGIWYHYEIEDEGTCTFTIPISTTLVHGSEATIPVMVDLAHIVAVIDFTTVPIEGEDLKVPEGSPEVRAALREAFGPSTTGFCN